jgi:hypothetical protein
MQIFSSHHRVSIQVSSHLIKLKLLLGEHFRHMCKVGIMDDFEELYLVPKQGRQSCFTAFVQGYLLCSSSLSKHTLSVWLVHDSALSSSCRYYQDYRQQHVLDLSSDPAKTYI